MLANHQWDLVAFSQEVLMNLILNMGLDITILRLLQYFLETIYVFAESEVMLSPINQSIQGDSELK